MKQVFFIIISFFLFCGFLYGQSNIGQPRLEPDARAFEFAKIGSSREYLWHEILDMALWASGADFVNRNEGSEARAAIISSGETLAESEDMPPSKEDQGEYLLDYLYRNFLKNYSERQTRLDVLVSSGRYNCVSSAVLYTILASSIGLASNGVLTKDHAFVQVNTGTELVDVETTTAYGYDPGSKKDFHDGFGNTTGFAYVAPRNYRDRSSISQLELVSIILSNRIADLESRGFFADAVGIAVDKAALLSMRLNPSDSPFFTDPYKDVTDRVFNYGASLIQAGKNEEALAWADTAESRYPDNRWQDFIFAAMNNRLLKMIQTKQIADARIFLDTEASRLSAEHYTSLEMMVTESELAQLSTQASGAEEAERALEKIALIERQGLISNARILELRTFVILKEAERRSKSSGWQEAAVYTENAINTYGSQSQLQNALRVYKNNQVVDLHNQFASLFNARNYEEAHRFIQNALQEFPGNRQLSSDLRTVERALNQH